VRVRGEERDTRTMRLSERGCDIKEEGETAGEIKLMKTRAGDRVTPASRY